MAKKIDEFKLTKAQAQANNDGITKADFEFVSQNEKITDKKFNTKPTTFLKDCIRRFRKNKSSVVAAWILGVLLVLSIFVPLFGQEGSIHAVNKPHEKIEWLEPRLFSKGNFWSGKRNCEGIPVDENGNPNKDPEHPKFVLSAMSDLHVGEEEYSENATDFGSGGYVKYSVYENSEDKYYTLMPGDESIAKQFDFENDKLTIKNFVALNADDLASSDEETKTLPGNFESAKFKLQFAYQTLTTEGEEKIYTDEYIDITEDKTSFNLNNIDINTLFNQKAVSEGYTSKVVYKPTFKFLVKGNPGKNVCTLIKSFVVETDSADKALIESISFSGGNECLIREPKTAGYWGNYSNIYVTDRSCYLSKVRFASFKYDTYQAVLGTAVVDVNSTYIQDYTEGDNPTLKLEYRLETVGGKKRIKDGTFVCEILDSSCPIAEEFSKDDVKIDERTGKLLSVHAVVNQYAYVFNLEKMPIFLMGTDSSGRDMFVNVFQGLRTSLLLGLGTTVVCFIFGLIWGSISGYFGGTVDLIMERFTDILSGIPWIVVMTLVIIKAGASFGVFALALCLTGWIGTAATTRTQFYRFRGREYVLASRTLGASHGRLIAKHILPNAMGTIITSAVLMVPSVIFEEATLSYLGLAKIGDAENGLSSLGVILSDNQKELTNHPYLLIFPSIVIALIMISFNLFGNGLRDAVNPSLKGEGE